MNQPSTSVIPTESRSLLNMQQRVPSSPRVVRVEAPLRSAVVQKLLLTHRHGRLLEPWV